MIEESLQEVIKGVVNGDAFPNKAPDGQKAPYAVYHKIVGVPNNTLSDGVTAECVRYQVDIYASKYSDMKARFLQLKDAMEVASFTNIRLMDQEKYDDGVKLHRSQSDWSIWT
jgi:hypothetical protein